MAINFSASFAACLAAGLKVPRQIMYCIAQGKKENFQSSTTSIKNVLDRQWHILINELKDCMHGVFTISCFLTSLFNSVILFFLVSNLNVTFCLVCLCTSSDISFCKLNHV
jgi:ABC-type maltose transport system permease subunit